MRLGIEQWAGNGIQGLPHTLASANKNGQIDSDYCPQVLVPKENQRSITQALVWVSTLSKSHSALHFIDFELAIETEVMHDAPRYSKAVFK